MCIDPIRKNYEIIDGKFSIDWHSNGSVQAGNVVELSCGKCIECQVNRSLNWAVRCVFEARRHKSNCFITLTYAESDGNLHKKDFQDFLKGLRKRIKVPIKYLMCGEYGSKGKRPHYHALIFGWCPDDLEFFYKSGNNDLYKSKFLSEVWNKGFITVGKLTFETALYTSKYLQKFQKIDDNLQQPYNCFSHYLGLNLMQSLDYDIDGFYINGKKYSVPRYIDKKAIEIGLISKDELRHLRNFNRVERFNLVDRYNNKINKIENFENFIGI